MEASVNNRNIHKNRKNLKQKKQLVEGGVIAPDKEDKKNDEEFNKEQEVVAQHFFQDIEEAEKEVERKTKPKLKEEDVEEEIDDVIEEEEVLETDESPEEEETDEEQDSESEEHIEEEVKEPKDGKIKLSETVEQALSPFKGDLSKKLEELVKSHNAAITELKTLQSVKKVVESLDVPEDAPQEQVIGLFKEARTILSDLESLPELASVIEGFYSGRIPEDLKPEQKTVKDFMPEELEYDQHDAVTDPNSESWKARIKWEDWNEDAKVKRQQFINKLNKKKQDAEKETVTNEQFVEKLKKAKTGAKQLKSFVVEEYNVDDTVYDQFVKDFSTFDPELMKVVFAVWARRNKMESKSESKIKRNSTKRSIESEIPSDEREDLQPVIGVSEKERKEFESFFGEEMD